MAQDELAGYTLLAGYGLLLVVLVRRFGIRRILWLALVIVTLGVAGALSTLRAVTSRRS